MERIFSHLYRFSDDFRKGQKYSYLLIRKGGNVLVSHFKRGSCLVDHFDEIDALGGISAQVVTPNHEVSRTHAAVHARFGCELHYHEAERKAARRKSKCASQTFGNAGLRLGDDFEGHFFPGHTYGYAIYRWRARGKYLLFTGDAITPEYDDAARKGNVVANGWMLNIDTRFLPHLRPQFDRLETTPIDYIFPSRSPEGQEQYHRFARGESRDCVRDFAARFAPLPERQ